MKYSSLSTVAIVAVLLGCSSAVFSAKPLSQPGQPSVKLIDPTQKPETESTLPTQGEQPENPVEAAPTQSEADKTPSTPTTEQREETNAAPTPAPETTQTQPQIIKEEVSQQETPKPPTTEEEPQAEIPQEPQTHFKASTTTGFEANLQDDGTISIYWPPHPTETTYHIYRQGIYHDTVYEPRYIDSKDLFDQSYYYKIQISQNGKYSYNAVGLTVDVTGTGRVDPDLPKPNANLLDGYNLVFEDEFTGSSLDDTKWMTKYWWGNDVVINYEEQHYVDIQAQPDFGFNPFSFDGDNLTITSIRTPPDLLEKANNHPYLSGVISSHATFSFTYGYIEGRAKLSYGQGLWYAFWLMNSYYDLDKPEIDIIESIGHEQDVVYHTYHFFDEQDNRVTTDAYPTPGIDYTTDFHTFGVEWLPGMLIFYVDRIERHRIVDPKVSQEEMYLLANTALGGWWPDSPDDTTPFPTEFVLDYIRVYQRPGLIQADASEEQPSQLAKNSSGTSPSPGHSLPPSVSLEDYPKRP